MLIKPILLVIIVALFLGQRIVFASLPATKKWLTENKWKTAPPFAI